MRSLTESVVVIVTRLLSSLQVLETLLFSTFVSWKAFFPLVRDDSDCTYTFITGQFFRGSIITEGGGGVHVRREGGGGVQGRGCCPLILVVGWFISGGAGEKLLMPGTGFLTVGAASTLAFCQVLREEYPEVSCKLNQVRPVFTPGPV